MRMAVGCIALAFASGCTKPDLVIVPASDTSSPVLTYLVARSPGGVDSYKFVDANLTFNGRLDPLVLVSARDDNGGVMKIELSRKVTMICTGGPIETNITLLDSLSRTIMDDGDESIGDEAPTMRYLQFTTDVDELRRAINEMRQQHPNVSCSIRLEFDARAENYHGGTDDTPRVTMTYTP